MIIESKSRSKVNMSSTRNRKILNLTIDLGDKKEILEIFEGDDHLDLA